MNGFALGKAFQAVGNDLGVSTQIQFDQSMQQQAGAQRAAMQTAHDQFMQKLSAQNNASRQNIADQELQQRRAEFTQRMQATEAHNKALEGQGAQRVAQGAQRTSAYMATSAANVKRLNAETQKLLNANSGAGGSKPPTQADLLNTNARLLGMISAIQGKLSTGVIAPGDKNTMHTLQQLTAEQQRVQAMLDGGTATVSTSMAPQSKAPTAQPYEVPSAASLAYMRANMGNPQIVAQFKAKFGPQAFANLGQ